MIDNFALNFIYTYKTNLGVHVVLETGAASNGGLPNESRDGGEVQAFYYILYSFSESQKLTEEKLKEIFEGILGRALPDDGSIGPFENLSELNQYVLKVCVELHAPQAYLLSVHDYNQGLEEVSDIRSFRHMFTHYGKKLLNPAFRPEKSSFFKRIFREG